MNAFAVVDRFDPRPPLLERRTQMRTITAAVRARGDRRGVLIAIAGAPGTGRTRLLLEAAEAGRIEGLQVVHIGFGGQDEATTLEALPELPEPSEVLIVVDNPYGGDDAAERLLTRRLGGLRRRGATVVTALRDGCDDGSCEPSAVVVCLGALSERSVSLLVAHELGAEAERAFAAECHAATAGNPSLVRELALELAGAAVPPVAACAGVVRSFAIAPVGRRLLTRLARHGPNARAIVIAAAVLGEGATTDDVVALAGVSRLEFDALLPILRRDGVFTHGDRTRFAAPLLARSVLAATQPSETGLWHRRAADVLEFADAPFEEIADHIVRSMPRADHAVVGRLRLGAHRARQVGAVALATAYLRRAFDEGSTEFERDIALELADIFSSRSPADAIVLFDRALNLTRAPDERRAIIARRDRLERGLLACTAE